MLAVSATRRVSSIHQSSSSSIIDISAYLFDK